MLKTRKGGGIATAKLVLIPLHYYYYYYSIKTIYY